MDARPDTGQRFDRESSLPRLAEAPRADAGPSAVEDDVASLLDRLERQAAESGRLDGRVQILERALKSAREGRQRLAETMRRERAAAKVLHARLERAEATCASQAAELQQLREAAAAAEHQTQQLWMQLAEGERHRVPRPAPRWRRLLGP